MQKIVRYASFGFVLLGGLIHCGPDSEWIQERLQTARGYYQQKELNKSYDIAIEIVDRVPENTAARMLAAQIEYYRSNTRRAEDHCRTILDINSDHYGAQLCLARILSTDPKRTAEAQELVESVIQTDSRNPEAWYLKGLLHERQNQVDKAILAYNVGLYSAHHLSLLHLRLASLYEKADLMKKRDEHLKLARTFANPDASLK